MKKLMFVFLLLLITGPLLVKAATDGATIPLSLAPASDYTTDFYNFTGKNQNVTVRVDDIYDKNYQQNLVVALFKATLTGSSIEFRHDVKIEYHTLVCIDVGNCKAGKHLYKFGSYSNAFSGAQNKGTTYSGIISKAIQMYSI